MIDAEIHNFEDVESSLGERCGNFFDRLSLIFTLKKWFDKSSNPVWEITIH